MVSPKWRVTAPVFFGAINEDAVFRLMEFFSLQESVYRARLRKPLVHLIQFQLNNIIIQTLISNMNIELARGKKVDLHKGPSGLGQFLINLKWNPGKAQKSFFGLRSSSQPIDLDLACLYELTDGRKFCLQALGNSFGHVNEAPYIALDGDDRTGGSLNGENLIVNGRMVAKIKRILVYTFIYDGVAKWKDADGVVRIKCPGSSEIVIRMDDYSSLEKTCAIAMLENKRNETFSVEKLVQFFPSNIQMDQAYNWGLNWIEGTKKPEREK